MSSEPEIRGEFPFAELAKRQKQQRRGRGRPVKSVRRIPTTVHLTEAERVTLGELQVEMRRYFPVNRSELAGVAIAVLAELVDTAISSTSFVVNDLDTFHAWAMAQLDFIKLKNREIPAERRRKGRG
jgi:hypothetical protein